MEKLYLLKDKKVLYVEDDESVRESTLSVLKLFFSNIIVAKDGMEALRFLGRTFDIVILDLKLPKVNGLEIAQEIRRRDKDTLIFMISSYQETDDLREALKIGMLDYIPKPLKFYELKNVLIECANRLAANRLFNFGGSFTYDLHAKLLYKDDLPIKLTRNELAFVEFVLKNKDKILEYEMISQEVFNSKNSEVNIPCIKNMLMRLRKKIGYELVESVSGIGYRAL